jgi:Outer membrane protein beta-barrel domain
MRYLFSFFLAVSLLVAQSERPGSVSLGFKVGSPLNDPSSQSSLQSIYNQGRWTGGPTVELHLPYRFAVEFDALYWNNRTNSNYVFQFDSSVNPYLSNTFEKTKSWDFPLLLKYRFQVGSFHPFVSAGYLFTHESINRSTFYQCSGSQDSCSPPDFPVPNLYGTESHESRFRKGPAAGLGLEFKTRYLTISPELRFSRLINTYPRDNRFTGMVGFTFGGRRE